MSSQPVIPIDLLARHHITSVTNLCLLTREKNLAGERMNLVTVLQALTANKLAHQQESFSDAAHSTD